MPTITLRITDDEHRNLQAMAEWKRMSMSDLVREYSRSGVHRDATAGDVREQIKRTIEHEQQRLESLAAIIEEAAATASTAEATDAPTPEPVHSTRAPHSRRRSKAD